MQREITLRGRKISFILFGGFIIVKRGIKMRRRMEINHHRTYRGKAAVFLLVTAALLAGCANERTEDELSYRKIGIESMQSGD